MLVCSLHTQLCFPALYEVEEGVVYSQPNGKKLRADLFVPSPSTASPRPAVVLIHGGAWFMGTRQQQHWYARQLAKQGYVVMAIDYRLLPKYTFPDCMEDCRTALAWLGANAGKYDVDVNRIAVIGASAGGHLAALLVTSPADHAQGVGGAFPAPYCAVCLYAPLDLADLCTNRPNRAARKLASCLVGRLVCEASSPDKEALAKASPATFADADTKPILLIHGNDDRVVPLSQACAFCAKLRSRGVPSRLIVAANRGHGFDRFHPVQRAWLLDEILTFLKENEPMSLTVLPERRLTSSREVAYR